MLIKFLSWFKFLCYPRKHFTQAELSVLQAEYFDAPVPQLAFDQFENNRNCDEHIADLLLVMRNFPEWKLSDEARDILNGTNQWNRAIGYGMFKLLTAGTDCTCCGGWRALVLCLLAFALGFGASSLTVT